MGQVAPTFQGHFLLNSTPGSHVHCSRFCIKMDNQFCTVTLTFEVVIIRTGRKRGRKRRGEKKEKEEGEGEGKGERGEGEILRILTCLCQNSESVGRGVALHKSW